MGLYDPNNGPDLVEDLGMGIINVFRLGHREEPPIAFQSFLNGFNRSGTTGRNWNRDSGVDHGVPKRKDR
jgi:hypothetical protein